MSELSEAIANFGNAINVLGADTGVDETTMTQFDAAISFAEGEANGESPLTVALAFGVGLAVVAELGPEILAAGVTAVIGEEVALSIAAAIDQGLISLGASGILTVTSGNAIVATTSTAVGGIVLQESVKQAVIFLTKLISSPNPLSLLNLSSEPITINNDAAVIANNADITINNSAIVSVNGSNNSITSNGNSTITTTGTGNTITMAAGTQANIYGANDTINIAANTALTLFGSANSIFLPTSAGSNGCTITLSGTNNSIINGFTALNTTIDSPQTFSLTDNILTTTLTAISGNESVAVGTLALNGITGTRTVTLDDGLVVSLPATGGTFSNSTSATTPLLALVSYLSNLGDSTSASSLDSLNSAYLNPTGTAYTITGTVEGSGDTAEDDFDLPAGSLPGAVINGETGPGGGVPNVLVLGEFGDGTTFDISQDNITDIQTLETDGNDVTLTQAQFAGFTSITGGGAITAASGGTFDLNNGNIDPDSVNELTATDWSGTTLIGNGGQVLNASLFGNDTLTAGSGTGDTLIAGEGVDTLIGSSGGSTDFIAEGGDTGLGSGELTAGSSVTGYGSGNSLGVNGDITGVSITGVQTLLTGASTDTSGNIVTDSITLTNSEWNGFTSIASDESEPVPFSVNFADAGTYNLATKDGGTTTGFNMTALSNGGTTLIGDDGFDQTLTASATGNDTLEAGNGELAQLVAGGGVDTLTGGTGGENAFIAYNGLAAGSSVTGGSDDFLYASGDISGATITGVGTLSVGDEDTDPDPTDITLTATQFGGFSTIGGVDGSTINAANDNYESTRLLSRTA